jgi:YbbR domain-containing protein
MSLSIKTTYLNALALKCLALIFGYALWHSVSSYQKIQITQNIPVCFYNTHPHQTVQAPETIKVTLHGKRKDLLQTAFDGALHCDAQHFQPGTTTLPLTKEQIFLPESVRLVHYTPQEITVVVQETHTNQSDPTSPHIST